MAAICVKGLAGMKSANWLGKFAFTVYMRKAVIEHGTPDEPVPEWDTIQANERELWNAAAETVYKTWFDEVEDKERERTS